MALAGVDYEDAEARAGAYMVAEFLAGFRGLLKSLSEKPKKHRGK